MKSGRLDISMPGIAVIFALAFIIAYFISSFTRFPISYVLPVVLLLFLFCNCRTKTNDTMPGGSFNPWIKLEAHNIEDLKIEPVNEGEHFEISGKSLLFPRKSLIELELSINTNILHIIMLQADAVGAPTIQRSLERSTDEDGNFKLLVKKQSETTKVTFGENEKVIWEA